MEQYKIPWRLYLPDELRKRRKAKKWSQERLAEEVDVDVRTVGRWERGQAFPYGIYRRMLQELFFTKEPPIERTARTTFFYFNSCEDIPASDSRKVTGMGYIMPYGFSFPKLPANKPVKPPSRYQVLSIDTDHIKSYGQTLREGMVDMSLFQP